MLDIGLSLCCLSWQFMQDIRIRWKVIWLWILHCIGSKNSNLLRLFIKPFVPSCTPAVVMDKDCILSKVYDLGLQPLVNCVLNVKPHPNLKFPTLQIELKQVVVILRIVDTWVCLISILSESHVLYCLSSLILRLQRVLIANLRMHESFQIASISSDDIKAFRLVKPNLF